MSEFFYAMACLLLGAAVTTLFFIKLTGGF